MTRAVERRGKGERGATVILTAVFLVVLFIAASFSIDLGGRAQQKRNDHLVADLAALDGVRGDLATVGNPADVISRARASAFRNNFDYTAAGNSLTVSRGHWAQQADGTFHFVAESTTACPCDAVQVTATSPYNDLFQNGHAVLSATSTAIQGPDSINRQGWGQFQIGSSLVTVSTAQSAVLNNLLAPFGVSSTLTAVGYRGLLTSNTTLGALAGAFPANLGFAAMTPDQFLASSVTVDQLIQAETNLLPAGDVSKCSPATSSDPGCSAFQLTALYGLVHASGYNSAHSVALGSLLGIQTGSGAGLGTSINLFNALVGSMQLADGNAAIDIPSLGIPSLTVPGVTNVSVGTSVQAVVPAKKSGYGPAPQTATDTQVTVTFDIKMNVSVVSIIPYLVAVDLPLRVTTGGATGTMARVDCPALPNTTPNDLQITPVNIQAVTQTINGTASIASLGLGSATLTGTTTVAATTVTNPPTSDLLTYNGANYSTLGAYNFYNPALTPPGQNVAVTVPIGHTDALTTSMTVTAGGTGGLGLVFGTVIGLATPVINTALPTIISAISTQALQPLLNVLGTHIGAADLLGIAARCATPVLVS